MTGLADCGAGASSAGNSSAGGPAGEGGSGAMADGDTGMRLYLSQIREWVVEFSADMLFISMRTDVAWYRLSK